MSDRIFAAVWLVVCLLLMVVGWGIQSEFSYEPVGPRAYPMLLLGLMLACSLAMALRPGEKADWPEKPVLIRIVLMILALLVYALLFEPLGFALATALMSVAIGRLFEGKWLHCVVGGAGLGFGLFYFFDRLLDVPLPAGLIFG
ncbi:tripartite tricarboxylate transporter TctB family protein [Vogesella oryzae]|uniref:tripartite tricarboxylate transporter TctB family protein n=1 Tax=Vogesella oryzae TaxID=1735285 RepID=UPI0015839186|nr:tripartite tricarboxylate transporter TctB family protein [Vogesella oryzae]